jgi:hypothetical protein
MKAKRFISAVCALAMTAASAATFVNAAGEQVIIKGDQIEKAAGASFELNFNLDKFDGTGFSGCEFAIKYDPKQITDVKVAEGAVLKNTGATAAELEKAPKIGEEVTMVNKGKYDCFDYNTAEVDGKNVIAVLWCTGLDSDKYWAKDTGSIVTVTGTVSKDAKEGDKIPVEMVAIPREGIKTMTFGYADGTKDVTYTSAVEQQGQITVVTDPNNTELKPLWGDVNDDGAVSAKDLVAMMQFLVSPKDAKLTAQGIVNGNMDQKDGNTDLKSDDILDVSDFDALKKYILGYKDYTDDKLPIKK